MLGCFAPELIEVHWAFVQLNALVAVTFEEFFKPHVDVSPGSLRAHKATPNPACKGSYKKQSEGRHNKDIGQQRQILWPQGQ